MPIKERVHQSGGPIPNAVVCDDSAESKPSLDFAQELARSVFGRGYIVVHEPIGDRFRKRAPSRIRAWRAQ
jgi:hypothetical protein